MSYWLHEAPALDFLDQLLHSGLLRAECAGKPCKWCGKAIRFGTDRILYCGDCNDRRHRDGARRSYQRRRVA